MTKAARRIVIEGRLTCGRCKEWLPISEFAVSRADSTGFNWQCRKCCAWVWAHRRDVRQPCPQCGRLMSNVAKLCRKCSAATRRMENSPHWKGGRHRDKDGYVQLYLPSHPNARPSSGVVFEHVVVMSRILGRPLCGDEEVHHLNGVRDDNREPNLELWVTSQPRGIRAENALAWAHEIIERYGNGDVYGLAEATSIV